jgi:hypothetical protein
MFADLTSLAKDSAESLWIPTWGNDAGTLLSFWPFQCTKAAVAIALIGADPRAFFNSSVSAESLHRASQLATEIALRWAKKQRAQAAHSESSAALSESSNSREHESQ